MKACGKRFASMALVVLIIVTFASGAYGLHSDVTLRDLEGNSVAGTTKAYSPKRTCGTTACHDEGLALRYGITNNIYEDSIAFAVKDHGPGYPSYGNAYEVPYPQHGVSAGYHFQQGRNASWSDPQRIFYGMPAFTSSPGMTGKY